MSQNILFVEKTRKFINRNGKGAVIRIDGEAANILEEFATQSGKSASQLASNFIKYAAENTVIKER